MDSLEVAAQCLSECVSGGLAPEECVTLAASGKSLDEILDASLTVPSEKMCKYLAKLRQSGYFDDVEPGQSAYDQRISKALEKWNAKFEPSPDVEAQAEAAKEEGNSWLKQGDPCSAIESYTTALKLMEKPVYFSNRAAAYIAMDMFTEAAKDCKLAVAMDDGYMKAHYRLGVSLAALGSTDDARTAFEKALTVDQSQGGKMQKQILYQISKLDGDVESLSTSNSMPPSGDQGMFGGGGGGNPGGMDMSALMGMLGGSGGLEGLMQNPMVANMMQEMMSDPSKMQDMMAQMGMGGAGGQGAFDGLAQDPEIAEAMADIKENGMGAASKYLDNPAIAAKLKQAMGMP